MSIEMIGDKGDWRKINQDSALIDKLNREANREPEGTPPSNTAHQDQPATQIPINELDLNGFIYIPSIGVHFAKERTLYGKNWADTHKELAKQGLEMPTPRETWELIFHLKDNLKNPKYPDFPQVYDDILKKTPKDTWHGEWNNAMYSADNGVMYVQRVVGVKRNGDLEFSQKERLENCLTKDCWVDSGKVTINSQGVCTKELGNIYEQGKNIYFWHPRDGYVARFGAYSGRADLDCCRNPEYSYSSLGVRAIRRESQKK